jgi:hypothetical protein
VDHQLEQLTGLGLELDRLAHTSSPRVGLAVRLEDIEGVRQVA